MVELETRLTTRLEVIIWLDLEGQFLMTCLVP